METWLGPSSRLTGDKAWVYLQRMRTTVFLMLLDSTSTLTGAKVCITEQTMGAPKSCCYDDYNNLLQTGYIIIYLQVFDMMQNSDKSELER